jgi:hypothetical protein
MEMSPRGVFSLAKPATPAMLWEPNDASPRVVAIGPSFQDIANTKGMTATALRVFLTTSHPKMPNLILTPEQIADVSAYILSLRGHQ